MIHLEDVKSRWLITEKELRSNFTHVRRMYWHNNPKLKGLSLLNGTQNIWIPYRAVPVTQQVYLRLLDVRDAVRYTINIVKLRLARLKRFTYRLRRIAKRAT